MDNLKGQGTCFHSLTDGIDTTTTGGKYVGRPKALSKAQVQHMHELLNNGKTQAEAGELLGFSANTIGRELRK